MNDVAEAANTGPSPAELAEIDRIRNAFKSDGEGDREDPIAYAREIVKLREELANFHTWGIIEIAVRNPSVSEYMEHWEGRAIKAEAEATWLRRGIEKLIKNDPGNQKIQSIRDRLKALLEEADNG